ncbi:MAG: carboxypeptidase regulatory-like domain-containing protein, partial [Armatimonadetes bacterium]|nr:carboxypeptidase regulatory-like domain-containing protein [Armatimonadota bacterium]
EIVLPEPIPIEPDATGSIAGRVFKLENGAQVPAAGVEVVACGSLNWVGEGDEPEIRPDNGAEALIFPPPDAARMPEVYVAVTDENGDYVIKGVEPGDYLVTAVMAGYEPAQAWVTVGPGERVDLELVLKPSEEGKPSWATISGTVTASADAGGQPVANGLVVAELGEPWIWEPPVYELPVLRGSEAGSSVRAKVPDLQLSTYYTRTDQQGHYELSVPPGTITVSAWAKGLSAASQTLSVAAGQKAVVDFALKPVYWIMHTSRAR